MSASSANAGPPMPNKRGRKRDDNLPPNRARDVQRAFRARRASHLEALEQRVVLLEDENSRLRAALDLPPSDRPPLGTGPTGRGKLTCYISPTSGQSPSVSLSPLLHAKRMTPYPDGPEDGEPYQRSSSTATASGPRRQGHQASSTGDVSVNSDGSSPEIERRYPPSRTPSPRTEIPSAKRPRHASISSAKGPAWTDQPQHSLIWDPHRGNTSNSRPQNPSSYSGQQDADTQRPYTYASSTSSTTSSSLTSPSQHHPPSHYGSGVAQPSDVPFPSHREHPSLPPPSSILTTPSSSGYYAQSQSMYPPYDSLSSSFSDPPPNPSDHNEHRDNIQVDKPESTNSEQNSSSGRPILLHRPHSHNHLPPLPLGAPGYRPPPVPGTHYSPPVASTTVTTSSKQQHQQGYGGAYPGWTAFGQARQGQIGFDENGGGMAPPATSTTMDATSSGSAARDVDTKPVIGAGTSTTASESPSRAQSPLVLNATPTPSTPSSSACVPASISLPPLYPPPPQPSYNHPTSRALPQNPYHHLAHNPYQQPQPPAQVQTHHPQPQSSYQVPQTIHLSPSIPPAISPATTSTSSHSDRSAPTSPSLPLTPTVGAGGGGGSSGGTGVQRHLHPLAHEHILQEATHPAYTFAAMQAQHQHYQHQLMHRDKPQPGDGKSEDR